MHFNLTLKILVKSKSLITGSNWVISMLLMLGVSSPVEAALLDVMMI